MANIAFGVHLAEKFLKNLENLQHLVQIGRSDHRFGPNSARIMQSKAFFHWGPQTKLQRGFKKFKNIFKKKLQWEKTEELQWEKAHFICYSPLSGLFIVFVAAGKLSRSSGVIHETSLKLGFTLSSMKKKPLETRSTRFRFQGKLV